MQTGIQDIAGRYGTPQAITMPKAFPELEICRIHVKIFTPDPLNGFNERPMKKRYGGNGGFREPNIKIHQAMRLPEFLQTLKSDGLLCADYFYTLNERDRPANIVDFRKNARSAYMLPQSARSILNGVFWKCEGYIHLDGKWGPEISFKLWQATRQQTGHIYRLVKEGNLWKLT